MGKKYIKINNQVHLSKKKNIVSRGPGIKLMTVEKYELIVMIQFVS